MTDSRHNRFGLLLRGSALAFAAAVAGTAISPGAAFAQDGNAAQAGPAEENEVAAIVVTGRLRNETLQDIPVSVTAVKGEELQSGGIVDTQVLAQVVPNFKYAVNVGASDNLFVRGLGTVGAGPQFEPAVGQQINGVVFSRSRIGRAGFLDVGQVELLRGPQGAASGRNNSLGLVNIVPNKPTAFLEGGVFAKYNFEDRQGYELEAFLSGPITSGIRGRLAASTKDVDGYVRNLNPAVGGTAGAIEDFSIRGMLDIDLGSRATFEILAQYVDSLRTGSPREISFCGDPAAALAAIGDDCKLNRTTVSQAIFNGRTVPEEFDLQLQLYTGTLNYQITDAITLTSVTAWTKSEITASDDVDLSSRARFFLNNAEDFSQFSQEVRLASELSDDVNLIVGGIFTDYNLDFAQADDYAFAANRRRTTVSRQRNRNYSTFADVTFDLTDEITLDAGVRYIKEDRAALAGQVQTDLFSYNNERGDCTGTGLTGCTFFPDFPGLAAGTVLAGNDPVTGPLTGVPKFANGPYFKTSDEDVTWNVNATWKPSAGQMLYASYATGFKAGAFNLGAVLEDNALNAQTFSLNPETSWNAEIGGKHTFDVGGGELVFNWTLYNMVVKDQQLSSLIPQFTIQVVTNAGKARSRGLEIEGGYSIDGFSLDYSFAYTDAEYLNYETGECYVGQPVQPVPAAGFFALGELGSGQCGLVEVSPGNTAVVQRRTGTTLTQAPKVQFSVKVANEFDLTSGLTLTPSAGVEYVGKHFVDTELAPNGRNDAYALLNAGLVLADADGSWELALVGRNLTDETHMEFFNESGQLDPYGGGAFAFPNVGRTVSLNARYRF